MASKNKLHRHNIFNQSCRTFTALMLMLVMVSGCLGGCSKQVSYRDCPEAYVKQMEYRDGFTILQLTDIHWSTVTQIGDESYGAYRYVKKVVEEAVRHAGQIDLIEVTGDTFALADKAQVRAFIKLMTELEIPYAMNWGNHDRESKYNPNWLSSRFSDAPYSLYTEVDNDDVHDRANYVIELTSNGETVWQLVNLDSGAGYRESAADFSLAYDYMRQDQLDWLKFMHDRAGDDVPVICYYHIPQLEFAEVRGNNV